MALSALGASGRVLVVAPGQRPEPRASARNLAECQRDPADSLNVVDLIDADLVLIEQPALARWRRLRRCTTRRWRPDASREIILRPVVSEKSIDESGRGKYTFAVHDDANKIQIKAAGRGALQEVTVTVVGQRPDHEGQGEATRHAARPDHRPHHAVAEGHRHPGPRPEDRILRGGLTDAAPQLQADLAGPPPDDPLDLRGDHHQGAAQAAARAAEARLGRNNQGRITVRHRGGGEKQHYRRIDFKRDKTGVPARVATIEYDPNRSARIGLLHYRDGEKRYILAAHGLKVGDVVVAGPDAEARVGNALPLANIPLGTTIHNIELVPGKGGQIVRSAGVARSCSPRRATTPRSGCRPARCAASAIRLHGDGRPGQQPRPREPEPRQGRPRPAHGPAARGPRRRHEPA